MENDETVKQFQMVELVPNRLGHAEDEEMIPAHVCVDLQRQAFEQGKQRGIEDGRAQNQARVDEELKRALQLANHLGQARMVALEERERDIVEVALVIARRIVRREIDMDSEMVLRQVRHILELLPHKALVTLRVHSRDLEVLKPLYDSGQVEWSEGNFLMVQEDERVDPGGCIVEQGGLLLDARITQQLETLAAEFGLEPIPS